MHSSVIPSSALTLRVRECGSFRSKYIEIHLILYMLNRFGYTCNILLQVWVAQWHEDRKAMLTSAILIRCLPGMFTSHQEAALLRRAEHFSRRQGLGAGVNAFRWNATRSEIEPWQHGTWRLNMTKWLAVCAATESSQESKYWKSFHVFSIWLRIYFLTNSSQQDMQLHSTVALCWFWHNVDTRAPQKSWNQAGPRCVASLFLSQFSQCIFRPRSRIKLASPMKTKRFVWGYIPESHQMKSCLKQWTFLGANFILKVVLSARARTLQEASSQHILSCELQNVFRTVTIFTVYQVCISLPFYFGIVRVHRTNMSF